MTDQKSKAIMNRETKQAIAMAKTMQGLFDTYFKVKPLISSKTKKEEKK